MSAVRPVRAAKGSVSGSDAGDRGMHRDHPRIRNQIIPGFRSDAKAGYGLFSGNRRDSIGRRDIKQTGKMENREIEEQDSFLRVGVVTQPHGLKGQVNVYPTTDEPGMFRVWKTLILSGKDGKKEVPLESAAYFKQMVILKLGGIDDRDAAERIRHCELFIRRSQAGPCAENEHFVADLIGLDAVDESGTVLGTCGDVMKTAANDVFVIQREGRKDLLIPAIPQCILRVDLAEKKILVHLLPGMLECYD